MIKNKKTTRILLICAYILMGFALFFDIFVEKNINVTAIFVTLLLLIFATINYFIATKK